MLSASGRQMFSGFRLKGKERIGHLIFGGSLVSGSVPALKALKLFK